MAVERAAAGSSLIDVLDRVLDKGIVIDAYVRVSLVGIDLVSVEARIVVASVETYLKFAEAIGITGFASRPVIAPPPGATEMDRILAENAELKRRLDELS
jgi:gas vesicle structural protein